MTDPVFASPGERVLPTLNPDGTRRWLNPKRSPGKFLFHRTWVGWSLIVVFVALPWVTINGRPAIWLNLPAREFTFFGKVFISTDTFVLMLTLLTIFVSVFLLTAALGRVWCGWGCPQTVYMELLFRPVEQALDRWRRTGHGRLRAPLSKAVKYALFFVFSIALAHTFLAYFVGVEALQVWITRSPLEHPGPFLVMAGTVGLMLFDFGYFREQMCTVICPYARLQSALLDRDSLVVGYDPRRGEPRGKGAVKEIRGKTTERNFGDCIDCGACVHTCPTGIDIRDGLQLECIGCAQCIDACDRIMDKVGAPRGLVRYSSQRSLETGRLGGFLRLRTVLYPVILIGLVTALTLVIGGTQGVDIELLRNPGAPFTLDANDRVQSPIRLRITNRENQAARYTISLVDESDIELLAPINPFPIDAHRTDSTTLFVFAPRDSFIDGSREIQIRVEGDNGSLDEESFSLLGPLEKASP
ncbi:MAG: cytochrome c oxidase accessory protein CcoG [Myxococcota bacterium]